MKPHDLKLHRDNPPGYPGPLHRPAEVAKILRCSEWWVKEQARKGRIPFSWIGGSYRFTNEHVAEIVRLFERRPATHTPPHRATPASRHGQPERAEPALQLTARRPRRARNADGQASIAA